MGNQEALEQKHLKQLPPGRRAEQKNNEKKTKIGSGEFRMPLTRGRYVDHPRIIRTKLITCVLGGGKRTEMTREDCGPGTYTDVRCCEPIE